MKYLTNARKNFITDGMLFYIFDAPIAEGYTFIRTFVPDTNNLNLNFKNKLLKDFAIKMIIDSRNDADSVELMCIQYSDICFAGGAFCNRLALLNNS